MVSIKKRLIKKNEGIIEHKELSPDKLKDYISIPYLTIFQTEKQITIKIRSFFRCSLKTR